MATTVTTTQVDESYLAQVRAFPLRRIRDDADLNAAIAVIDGLLDRPDLTNGEQEYLDTLGLLIEAYESEHVTLPEARGVDVLRHLMEENSLRQSDLVYIFGTKSVISEVLSGKRRLTVRQIQGLSTQFGVTADVFMDPAEQSGSRR